MNFPREKRLLLGWLALLAPLPLPFNEILGWGWYLLFAVGVGAFLVRSRRHPERAMPNWLSNLLALAYVPFLLLDLTTLATGGIAGPVLRLGLFAILLKLFALRRERDKWQAVMAIFFVFLAAAATSVHLTVVIYLLAFLVLVMLLLVRFALFHLLAGFGRRGTDGVEVPLGSFLAVSALLSLLVAIPLFALLPRVHSPYLGGPGRISMGSSIGVTGFSDEVTLDSIGRIRTSREVALRLTYDGMPVPREIRLKAGAFDRFVGRQWERAGSWQHIRGRSPQRIDLSPPGGAAPALGEVAVWLQPLGAKGVPLPVEATGLEVPWRGLLLDQGGALRFQVSPRQPVEYTVRVGAEPLSVAPPPEDGPEAATLDLSGVSPRMGELAARVMGTGGEAERARRLEAWLSGDDFRYTLERVGGGGDAPLEEFLFDHRSGHCEYFASAMVLLLRSQGIHARLVTGFLGGEPNPLGYVVVRQSNAHAWVEAWLPEAGWTRFDPTPAAGRPGLERTSLLQVASQLYDSLVFQWDRYVLSYGVEDQVQFVYGMLRGMWRTLGGLFGDDGEEPAPASPADPSAEPAPAPPPSAETLPVEWERRLLTAALVLLALLLAQRLWRAYHGELTAARAYLRLRHLLARHGVPFDDATGPLALRRRAVTLGAASVPAGRVVDLYVRESFGRRPLDADERLELREALDQTRRALRSNGDARDRRGRSGPPPAAPDRGTEAAADPTPEDRSSEESP